LSGRKSTDDYSEISTVAFCLQSLEFGHKSYNGKEISNISQSRHLIKSVELHGQRARKPKADPLKSIYRVPKANFDMGLKLNN